MNAGSERESVDDDLSLAEVQARAYLATSYSAETEAERFYDKAARCADNPETKRLLSEFAGDEKRHQEELTSAYQTRFREPPAYQPSDLPLPEQIEADTRPLEVLRIALEAEQKAQQYYQEAEQSMIDPELKRLFKELEKAEKTERASGSVDDFLNAFTPMIKAVDKFFDDVLVMDEDPRLRENRLALLQRIVALADGVADLSYLEGF